MLEQLTIAFSAAAIVINAVTWGVLYKTNKKACSYRDFSCLNGSLFYLSQ